MINNGYAAIGSLAKTWGATIGKPLFIVGTGRCGTTLLAKILRTHKGIAGFPNEANEVWHPRSYPYHKATIRTPSILEDPKCFTQLSVENWPEGHEERIKRIFTGFLATRGNSKKFFLKSAMISFMMPKLLFMFPDARFIHMYRNGVAVVRSLVEKEWKKYEKNVRNPEEFRRSCARYWNDCILEIDRMMNTLPEMKGGLVYEISYEALCAAPQKVIRELADYMEVERDVFDFDLSTIKSQNHKVEFYQKDAQWRDLLEIMHPAMKLKGYIQ